jgi:lactoylglutathione lyase
VALQSAARRRKNDEQMVLRKIDCVMIRVNDVEAAAAYYAKVFGLSPQWSGDDSIGLTFPETDAEIVLHNDPDIPSSVEVHYLVDDVVEAVAHMAAQGCHVLVAPFDITIGKCAVIRDPFGTRLCILDLTKGLRPLNLVEPTTE